jgi:death-on-curing family protein
MTCFPTLDYILEVFKDQIDIPRLINRGGLISTLDKLIWGIPSQGVPTIWERAAILFKEIVENHYFFDGNKRIGILIAFIFLSKNGFDFYPPKGEIYSVTMEVAQGMKEFNQISDWFRKNSMRIND